MGAACFGASRRFISAAGREQRPTMATKQKNWRARMAVNE